MLQSRPDLNMSKRLPDSLKDHLTLENGDKQADELPCRLEEVESLARTEEEEPLVRIVEVEPMQVEEGGDGVVHNQQQVERDLDNLMSVIWCPTSWLLNLTVEILVPIFTQVCVYFKATIH